MANKLKIDKQIAVITALSEGMSVRSIERMTGVHRDTVLRLMVRIGDSCAGLSNEILCDLDCHRIEVDEIWGYVAKKQRNVTETDNPTLVGDQYTFVALDPDTKLVPAYRVGKRTAATTHAFLHDLKSRLRNRVQLSSDAFEPYVKAVEASFGTEVDYAQIVKSYDEEPAGRGRYSPGHIVKTSKDRRVGVPKMSLVSTSHVERQNLTMRMHCRRLTRLTNAFSKKLENMKAAIDVHFAVYNFSRIHRTLRCTPAMEAGVVGSIITVDELVEMAQ